MFKKYEKDGKEILVTIVDEKSFTPDPTWKFIEDMDSWESSIPKEPLILAQRDSLISEVQWRYERYARETRLGIPTTDSLENLDNYVQALADLPKQKGFPSKIKWPELKGK